MRSRSRSGAGVAAARGRTGCGRRRAWRPRLRAGIHPCLPPAPPWLHKCTSGIISPYANAYSTVRAPDAYRCRSVGMGAKKKIRNQAPSFDLNSSTIAVDPAAATSSARSSVGNFVKSSARGRKKGEKTEGAPTHRHRVFSSVPRLVVKA